MGGARRTPPCPPALRGPAKPSRSASAVICDSTLTAMHVVAPCYGRGVARRTAALLIDDDARLGALVKEYLGKHEVDVTVAGDGPRGLAALRKERFDVVLLDV